MAATLREAMFEQERNEARMLVTYAHTAIANALLELRDGDIDAAIATLEQIVPSGGDAGCDGGSRAGTCDY